jgi:hypothetical protein
MPKGSKAAAQKAEQVAAGLEARLDPNVWTGASLMIAKFGDIST